MLYRYHKQLESDLLGRGVDLLDFWRGSLSIRRLVVLIETSPRESAFRRAADPDGTAWGEAEHLIAHLIDVTLAVNGNETRIDRPGQAKAKSDAATARGRRWEQRVAQRAKQREGATS